MLASEIDATAVIIIIIIIIIIVIITISVHHWPLSAYCAYLTLQTTTTMPLTTIARRTLLLAAVTVGCVGASGATPIEVTCVGDSITVAGGPDADYPAQLATMLGPGFNVTNRGVSGRTMMINGLCAASPAGSWRHPCLSVSDAQPCSGNCSYWATPEFQETLASSPDVITIMLGTNDAKFCNWYGSPNGAPAGAGTTFASDYAKMIKLFKAMPSQPKVFVVLPPPGISQCSETGPAGNASVCLAYNMSFHAINEMYPVLQRQIAKDAGADGVIDVWSALNGTTCTTLPPGTDLEQPPCPHTMDGIHPYPDAAGAIAATIAKTITSATTTTFLSVPTAASR